MKNTKVILEGDEFIISASWVEISNHLGDYEEAYVDMMEEDGELEVSTTSEPATTDLESFVHKVQVATTSHQMDGWDPFEEDEDYDC